MFLEDAFSSDQYNCLCAGSGVVREVGVSEGKKISDSKTYSIHLLNPFCILGIHSKEFIVTQ